MMSTVLNVLLYAIFATFVSQTIGIGLMWWLGLKPDSLRHEIEDVQNTAVGAAFFIIALTASIFIGVLTAAPEPADSVFATYAWIFGGILLATFFTTIAFWIAHRLMDPLPDENTYSWIRRELIDEQNAALAFFLGGLAVAPFIAVVSQIVKLHSR